MSEEEVDHQRLVLHEVEVAEELFVKEKPQLEVLVPDQQWLLGLEVPVLEECGDFTPTIHQESKCKSYNFTKNYNLGKQHCLFWRLKWRKKSENFDFSFWSILAPTRFLAYYFEQCIWWKVKVCAQWKCRDKCFKVWHIFGIRNMVNDWN